MTAPAEQTTASRTDADNEPCHVVCGKDPNRTLCGLYDDSDTWCPHGDDCPHMCVVCRDLIYHVAAEGKCEVCGTACWEEDK